MTGNAGSVYPSREETLMTNWENQKKGMAIGAEKAAKMANFLVRVFKENAALKDSPAFQELLQDSDVRGYILAADPEFTFPDVN